MRAPVSPPFDLPLNDLLHLNNADELKSLLALIPGVTLKAPRKAEVVDVLVRHLLGAELQALWNRLNPLQQAAVAEAAHDGDGIFDPCAFHAKYRALPPFQKEGSRSWDRTPTSLRLFLHPAENGVWFIPSDLRKTLAAFVPKPPRAQLASLDEVPAQPPRMREVHRFDTRKGTTTYESHDVPLVQRLTAQAALQDLRTVLRLIDQGKIAVSATTLLPSAATMTLLHELLREGDFFDLSEKANDWDPEVGPVKGFSWPLLVQAGRLAAIRNGKLSLTKLGQGALGKPPAEVLRDLWQAWLTRGLIDEFSRIDTIKGQKGKGRRGFTPPADRRLAIRNALAECPVGRWVETGEFSRYMRAAGFQFIVTRDPWSLYLCDPKYGSLGYEGHGGWNILQERYLLCVLFEYAAPLGIIDVAYEHPAGARTDYGSLWGTDDLIFLSRYDGLQYLRVTDLGAFVLGLTDRYDPPPARPNASLTVLPKGQIRLDQGELHPDQRLLLDSFADQETDQLWTLNEVRSIQAVERGARVADFRAFLGAHDPQPLPEAVDAFLRSVELRGAACTCKGSCLLIECLSPEIAEAIARDRRAGALCQRAGDRGLVLPLDKEASFREALNALGYGMPRV